jgi:hypothetical protein
MAKPSLELIAVLRQTADRLRDGVHYAWGNHGACNCGHLLQVITNLEAGEILRYAHAGNGEWTELAEAYCGTTNTPVALLMQKLEEAGLTPVDIKHIENLTDRDVLSQLPGGFRWLKKNVREDVIQYFETFARLLEERLINSINVDITGLLPESQLVND